MTTTKKKWTFIVWLAGDNNLEQDAYRDLAEMKSVGSNADVNIVAQCDVMSGHVTRRYLLRNGTQLADDVVGELGETNTGDPAVAIDFITWAHTNYPADHYAVVIWNHGSGIDETDIYANQRAQRRAEAPTRNTLFSTSLQTAAQTSNHTDRGIAYDDTDLDFLDNAELRRVLAEATAVIGKPIDLVGFDACLMAMVELGYELRSTADVMVGSEEIEPGGGWPYDKVLGRLAASPDMTGSTLGEAIVKEYIGSYTVGDVTQSACDLRGTTKVADAVKQLATALTTVLDKDGGDGLIGAAAARTASFDNPDYLDLVDFVRNLAKSTRDPQVATAATAVEQAVIGERGYVIASGTHGDAVHRATGATVFFPTRGKTQLTYGKLEFAGATQWGDFLSEYAAAIAAG